jgi:site-specific DNA recombinase
MPKPLGIPSSRQLLCPIQLKRRGVEAKLVMQSSDDQSYKPDSRIVAVLADAHHWSVTLQKVRPGLCRDLARQNNRDAADVSRTLPIAFLSPAIVEEILDGRQPVGLTPRALKRIGMLSYSCGDQRRRLGFPA